MHHRPKVEDVSSELHHPHTFVGKYVFSQDAKWIGIQYGVTALAVGLVGLVLSDLIRLQLGFPHAFSFITPSKLPAIRLDARIDHGGLSAHGAVPGRIRQLPDPADGSAPATWSSRS